MAIGVDGTKAIHGTPETAGMTSGTTLGATVEEPTGTILGAGTVLGATADITMATGVTEVMVATAVLAASAAITDGTTKAGAESSLAAGAIPNLPLTTDYGASKFNQELCPTAVR